jgi:DsbC/DsbD-like thiol-disulfide interchange protein
MIPIFVLIIVPVGFVVGHLLRRAKRIQGTLTLTPGAPPAAQAHRNPIYLRTEMLQRSLLLFISLSILLSFSACSKTRGGPTATSTPAPNGLPPTTSPISSVSFVKANAAEVQIAAGGSAEATVRLTIQSGYHLNANPASDSYLKATELTVQTMDGVSVGFVTYPTAVTKTFSFAKKPLAVYEGETEIKVMLKAAKSAPKSQRSLAANLNVQACDDQVCYVPGRIDLSIPVTVK